MGGVIALGLAEKPAALLAQILLGHVRVNHRCSPGGGRLVSACAGTDVVPGIAKPIRSHEWQLGVVVEHECRAVDQPGIRSRAAVRDQADDHTAQGVTRVTAFPLAVIMAAVTVPVRPYAMKGD
jgi:hypothetical protein